MHWAFIVLILVLCVGAAIGASVFYLYVMFCRSHRPSFFKSGDVYTLDNKTYRIPLLPMEPKQVQIMTEKFMIQQHDLFRRFQTALNEFNIRAWISGGTLLGMVRHKTFIPWDDDIDVHTMVRNRKVLRSEAFRNYCRDHGLKLYEKNLHWFPKKRTSKELAVLHVHLADHREGPHLDVFYRLPEPNQQIGKIVRKVGDQWILDPTRKCPSDWIFPLHRQVVDGLDMDLPNQPETLLEFQYGKNVMKSMIAPPWTETHVPYYLKRPFGHYVELN